MMSDYTGTTAGGTTTRTPVIQIPSFLSSALSPAFWRGSPSLDDFYLLRLFFKCPPQCFQFIGEPWTCRPPGQTEAPSRLNVQVTCF